MAKPTNRGGQLNRYIRSQLEGKEPPTVLEFACYQEHPTAWHMAKAIRLLKAAGDDRWKDVLELMTDQERAIAKSWAVELRGARNVPA